MLQKTIYICIITLVNKRRCFEVSEKKMFQQPDWFRLDNAGILFPGQNTNKWSNIFRVSIELKEEIDPDILKQAVKNILPPCGV